MVSESDSPATQVLGDGEDELREVVNGLAMMTVHPDGRLLQQVQSMGDANRKWVGLLPSAAWTEYANRGTIVAAVATAERKRPGALLGYAAYRLPRNEVVIAHLVVADDARGTGVAKAFIRHLQRRYEARQGLRALCRRDWPSYGLWPKLGFVARGDRPGRSSAGHLLTSWWLDHGHSDLMTWQGAPADLRPVVLDSNVFLDLHGKGVDGATSKTTREVLLQVLEGRIELLVTPEIHNEINRSTTPANRSALHSHADTYPQLAVDPLRLEAMVEQLAAAIGTLPTRPQAVSDIRHVAYAACAGAQVVVTRDTPAIKQLRNAALELAGVRMVTPEELVLLLDEIEDAPAYWPSALLGTGYTVTEIRQDAIDEIRQAFLDTGRGERRQDFDRRVWSLAKRRPAAHLMVYRDPDNSPVALIGCEALDETTLVSLLRVRPAPLAASLAAQSIDNLRRIARTSRAFRLVIDEPQLSELMFSAAISDGFKPVGDRLVGVSLPTMIDSGRLPAVLASALESADRNTADAMLPLRDAVNGLASDPKRADIAAALEHQLRPLRILDAAVPCWLVPIKPHWASQLFNVPQQLYHRPSQLGISIEHVYYRSPRSAGERAPGRVLWYISSPECSVVACSSLIEVAQDFADDLWRRFRRLGVYERDDVRRTANNKGIVRALRVTDTQLFQTTVPLRRLRQIFDQTGERLHVRSAAPISQATFAQIMCEGRHDS